ncbi:DNA adenine methylase [Patescibacteria group bacterium]|nr:DNA adenine methylase [Patescibacteria group bacterium]MBU4309223.1 DNA adenine methylase [Patescibacteria group bacterium]MBU4432124.1 DNA adenine methylase [Patescibacteria group bacterium]MBU4577584.1 DNA adenine methylase [Patescibacteria group bacterium]
MIQATAVALNVHPIHVRLFLATFETAPPKDEDVVISYKKFVADNPKPFVKWVGGKRQLVQQFKDLNLYPPYKFNPKTATYFEPFVGGGAMFFDLLPKRAVLSDMNLELVTTYNVIKNDVSALIKKLKEHQKKNTKDYFLKVRALKVEKLSDVNRAARFIYLNRTCFNGMYRVNSSGGFNVPYGDNKNPLICDEVNLLKARDAMKETIILHQDYKYVLDKAKKGDFIYFDPPYYPVNKTSSFTSYTKEGFLEQQQEELRDTFLKLHKRGCYVMLSNSDTKFINDLYFELDRKIKIKKVFAGRAINSNGANRGKIKEVVVVNY